MKIIHQTTYSAHIPPVQKDTSGFGLYGFPSPGLQIPSSKQGCLCGRSTAFGLLPAWACKFLSPNSFVPDSDKNCKPNQTMDYYPADYRFPYLLPIKPGFRRHRPGNIVFLRWIEKCRIEKFTFLSLFIGLRAAFSTSCAIKPE